MQPRPEIACGRWDADTLVLAVRIQPRARRLALGPLRGERVLLSVTAPPSQGKANRQAREYLAHAFGVSPSRVMLARGESGRDKLFRIDRPERLPPGILRN